MKDELNFSHNAVVNAYLLQSVAIHFNHTVYIPVRYDQKHPKLKSEQILNFFFKGYHNISVFLHFGHFGPAYKESIESKFFMRGWGKNHSTKNELNLLSKNSIEKYDVIIT